MFYIKQQNELVCSTKNSWTQMRPDAKPIEFTNGHAPFLPLEKVDQSRIFISFYSRSFRNHARMLICCTLVTYQC